MHTCPKEYLNFPEHKNSAATLLSSRTVNTAVAIRGMPNASSRRNANARRLGCFVHRYTAVLKVLKRRGRHIVFDVILKWPVTTHALVSLSINLHPQALRCGGAQQCPTGALQPCDEAPGTKSIKYFRHSTSCIGI
jgi:hypothetical protein